MQHSMKCILAVLLLTLTGHTHASRQESLNLLGSLPQNWNSAKVDIKTNNKHFSEVVSGDNIVYEFESTEPGYLLLVHLDSHGELTLIRHKDPENWFLEPNQPITFPSQNDNFTIEAVHEPLGTEHLLAILTDAPLILPTADLLAGYYYEKADVTDILKLKETLENEQSNGGLTSFSHMNYRVVAEDGGTEYKTRFVVRYFSDEENTSASTNPQNGVNNNSLQTHINFKSGSSNLTYAGKRDLDIMGDALSDPALANSVFKITGHTDDIGSTAFNRDLSLRRAEEVEQYLLHNFGINQNRFQISYEGENSPISPNTTALNRSKNRRVEFARVH